MFARLLLLMVLMSPLAALAQDSWSAVWLSGTAVMDEPSQLTFQVRNTSSGTRRLSEVVFTLNASYDVDGGTAPAGWTVVSVDRSNRRITFRATNTCPSAGLAPGQSTAFSIHVVGLPATNDQLSQAFVNGTSARDTCANRSLTGNLTFATWRLVSLSARILFSPQTLGVGGDAVALYLVENRSTRTQSQLQPDTLQPTGTATFTSTPLTSPLSLAPGASGVYAVQSRATGEGTAIAQAFIGNSLASSPTVQSPPVNVRPLAAALDVSTERVSSGDTVTVRLTVSNTSASNTYRDVVPQTPTSIGTAAAALLSGPQPASVASLAPGQSAQFTWQYRLTGAGFSGYRFQAGASAMRSGAPVTTDTVESEPGVLSAYRLRVSPEALLPGANAVVSYTLTNLGTEAIRELRLAQPAPGFFTVAASPFVNTPAGWLASIAGTEYIWTATGAGLAPGASLTVGLRFSTVTGATVSGTARDVPFSHRMRLALVSGLEASASAPVTVMASKTVPEVASLVALSGEGRNTLIWSNPSDHGGVMVLRSTGAAPNTLPVPGVRYSTGDTLGNARVVYVDEFSAASRFADTSVTNGTEYFYRVLNHDDLRRYAAGNQPTSLGIRATPRQRGAGAPLWCYSVGFASLQQPITEVGKGIFTSFNDSVIANLSNTGSVVLDGDERWRPLKLSGLIGSRFPVVPLHGLSGQYLFVGDQAGAMYGLNAYSGEVLWRGDNGQSLGVIQSFPVTQLHDFANAAYKAARPNQDLVFFASRNGTANNKVIALDAATGQRAWLYAPGDLDMVSGGMLVDYVGNRLFVASKSNGGSQASLRVLSTLNGQELARLSLGDLEHSVVRNSVDNQLYITASDGTVHGVSLVDLKVLWSQPTGAAPTSFVRPVGPGFAISLQSGVVQYYTVLPNDTGGITVTLKWQTPIATPTGVFAHSVPTGGRRLYVGSSDGKVHELDGETGADLKQVSLGAPQRIGMPTIDSSVGRLHVGTQDGRICAFPVPFP